MYNSVIKSILPDGFIWFLLVVIVIVIFIIIFLIKVGKKEDFSNYIKKQFIFDTKNEFELFELLVELFGDKYYVFPQVHYGHIIETRKGLSYSDRMHYWNKINRKSADFILCDKIQVVPQLIIELDGGSHDWDKRKERDEFINEITKIVGLPILHLKTNNLDREYLRNEIDKVLIQ